MNTLGTTLFVHAVGTGLPWAVPHGCKLRVGPETFVLGAEGDSHGHVAAVRSPRRPLLFPTDSLGHVAAVRARHGAAGCEPCAHHGALSSSPQVRSPAARQVASAWHSASAWHDAQGGRLPAGGIAGSSSKLLSALVHSLHPPNAVLSAVSSASAVSGATRALSGAQLGGAVPSGAVPGASSLRGSSFAPGTALGHAAEWGAEHSSGDAVAGGSAVVSTIEARGNAHLHAEIRELRHALSDGAPSQLERRLWKSVIAADGG